MSRSNIGTPDAQFGRVVYPPGGTHGPRMQTGLQLVGVESGEVTVYIDRRAHHLAEGRMCLLFPGHHEFFRFTSAEPTQHIWCTLTPPPADLADELLRRRSSATAVRLPWQVPITPMLGTLCELGLTIRLSGSAADRALRVRLSHAMFQAFAAAVEEDDAAQKQSGVRRRGPVPPSLARAIQFVEQHLAQEIDLPRIAEAAGVSPTHVARLFKTHRGMTASAYLWRVRTQHGRALLRDTGLTIAEIAYRSGFKTPYHFSRHVRRQYGQSPRALRQRMWSLVGSERSQADER